MEKRILDQIKKIIKEENIIENPSMMDYTSFKIGGNANLLIEISGFEEVEKIIKFLNAEDIPYYIVGNGTNLLVDDNGFPGVILRLQEKLDNVRINGTEVIAESGVLLSKLSNIIVEHELTGFEFGSGIPGTIGGAITMNAGAYDGEMKNIVKTVKVFDGECIRDISAEDMNFSYRTSDVIKKSYIVLEVVMDLQYGNKDQIKAKIADFTERRTSKQPLTMPSAGSTFKRPPGYFAGKLIDDSGLRGLSVGGAQISEKHCGFVVNRAGATSEDVKKLIAIVKKVVYDKFGVLLEEEVKYLGGNNENIC